MWDQYRPDAVQSLRCPAISTANTFLGREGSVLFFLGTSAFHCCYSNFTCTPLCHPSWTALCYHLVFPVFLCPLLVSLLTPGSTAPLQEQDRWFSEWSFGGFFPNTIKAAKAHFRLFSHIWLDKFADIPHVLFLGTGESNNLIPSGSWSLSREKAAEQATGSKQ